VRGNRIGWIAAASAVALAAVACGGGGKDGDTESRVEPVPSSTTTTATLPSSPTQLVRPADPNTAAATLLRVERGLRDPSTSPEQRRVLGWTQQLSYAALSSHPEWDLAVFAALPADLHDVVRANAGAGRGVGGITPTQPRLPRWYIRPPLAPEQLRAFYAEAEVATGVTWAYLAAIHFVETRMGRIVGDSSAGAQGPMQFIPSSWRAYGQGGDVASDHDAILAAGRYLAAAGFTRDVDRAIYAYNHSDRYVAAVKAYAGVMLADARAYDGYHAWQVWFAGPDGTVLLEEGWRSPDFR